MIRENQRWLNLANAVMDGALIIIAYLLSTWLWLGYYRGNKLNIAWMFSGENLWVAVLYALLLVTAYWGCRLYGSFRFSSLWDETQALLKVNALGVVSLAALLYIFRLQEFSRGVLVTFYIISSLLVVCKRVTLRSFLRHFRKLGYNQKHVILVGNGALALQYEQSLKKTPHLGFVVDGYVARTPKPELGRRLGCYEELEDLLRRRDVDEVVVALEPHESHQMPMILRAAEQEGVRISIIPYYNDYIPSRPTVDLIGNVKLFNIRTTPLDNLFNAALKRGMDVVGSAVLILITSPLMLVIALGVKISSPGPVLFMQDRVGKNKKIFKMLKFRSMRVNSSEKTGWSEKSDPRKTRFGSFIRKFSLDELPQFFNVLVGQMSLVGPRPEVPYHVDHFRDEIPLYLVRQQVRPGMTGWAQVNGWRGDTSIRERVEHDIWYIENWSLGLDLKILFKTVFGGMVNNEQLK